MTRALIIILSLLAAVGCSGEPATAPPGERRLQAASQGLCDAQVLAAEGRVRQAADIFDAESHDYLHELARMVQDVDPEAAAELLEAKQRVESIFSDGRDPVATQELISKLQRALLDAAAAIELPAPLCQDGAS